MTDAAQTSPRIDWRKKLDWPWVIVALMLLSVALFDTSEFVKVTSFAAQALVSTAPFILFAVVAVAFLKATGAENLLARAFEGNPARMIVLAALLGGLSPFCSCEVIPFIAALLAVGAPLGAVMAFWLASPLMDPAMFAITTGAISLEFAIAKTLTAVAIGILGGFGALTFANSPVFKDPLRERPNTSGCCGVKNPFSGKPHWRFWTDGERVRLFREVAIENGLFLFKWLTLAYVVEAIMITYIPADLIATTLGGEGLGTIILGAIVGMPAYLNGYAAAALISQLLDQGMAPGAAMSFMIAGGVSCIPAAMAVWPLVKPRIFAAYLGFATLGAILSGLLWQIIA